MKTFRVRCIDTSGKAYLFNHHDIYEVKEFGGSRYEYNGNSYWKSRFKLVVENKYELWKY